MGAAYSGHLYSGQPLRVDDIQSSNEQIYNTETAGYKGQPLLVDKSVRSRGVHCKRRPLYMHLSAKAIANSINLAKLQTETGKFLLNFEF